MKSIGNTKADTPQVKSKKFLVVVGCALSINAIAANSLSNSMDRDSNNGQEKINWIGPYVGGFIGGAWGRSNINTNAGTVTSTSYFTSIANILSVNQNGSKTFRPNAFIGGIEGGNNWILNNLLYGIVLDFGSFRLHSFKDAAGIPYPAFSATYSLQTLMKTNWLFTARGRLGFIPFPKWPLVYATGGLAVTKLQVANTFFDTATSFGVGTASDSNTKTGWTVGGGLELPIAKNVTINSEYLYVHFGSASARGSVRCSATFCSTSSQLNTSANFSANLLKVGINYKS